MGQQPLLNLSTVQNNPSIYFNPQIHQFESQNIQRIKETPFTNSILYSTQPFIYIQPSDMIIQSLVAPRMNTTKLFPKQEIYKIIQNLLNGLKELKARNFQRYGNISLTSIFYHKNLKLFKLVNPAFYNSVNYLMARQGLRFCFLAPQQLLTLTTEGTEQIKTFKTDIFILAVCLLQICTLRDSREIYCPETYNIFDVQIKDRLKDIEEFYSLELSNFLQLCLEYQLDKRIDLQNAYDQIKFIRQKQKNEQLKPNNVQLTTQNTVLSPRVEPKKGSLPFGPGHLPKKLQSTNSFNNL